MFPIGQSQRPIVSPLLLRESEKLKKEPWGARTLIVRDPVGNLVLFAGPSG